MIKYATQTVKALVSPSSGITADHDSLRQMFDAEKDLASFGRSFHYRLLVGAMTREYRNKLRKEAEQALGRKIKW